MGSLFFGEPNLNSVELDVAGKRERPAWRVDPGVGGMQVAVQFTADNVLVEQPLIVMFPKVQVKRPPGVEVVFGREPHKLIGLDDLRGLILYVEQVIESFAGDVQASASAAA